ncbi:MAG: xylulokinase [Planctomycetaceae bacterium]|jgi:xylulokinase|nr:xylulokinase [Planctomycetaceae bacterium]
MAFLGIDIGTSGTKTLAVDEKGKILASDTQEYPCYAPKPLWSEQDPDDWWNAVVKSVKNTVKKAKLKPADVKAIGLSGQMHGSVFLDKNGKVIRRAILWNDQRTVAECEEITKRAGGREKLIGMVANPALTGFTAPKILWLRNNEPKNFDKLKKVLLPKDEIRRWLTGEYATEVSDASGMLLLDVAKRNWSAALLGKLDLDIGLFGKVYESEDITGNLTAQAAELLGLTTDCVVVGGAGDCAAGAVGNGIVSEGILSTSVGTSGVMFVHSDEVKIDPLGRVHTFCHAVRGKYHLMGVNLSSGGSLQWFRNALTPELSAIAKSKKIDVYELLTEEAKQTPVGAEGLYFLPYLSGERTPHADPFARGCFIGLTLTHTRGHLVRSIMEGVTFSLRDSLEIFQGLDIPVKQIRASGGGSKSAFWRQIQADVFGQRVVTVNSVEGPAYGVALLAAVGTGAYKNIQEACKAVISTVSETKPNPKAKKIYDAAMPVYQGLYLSLKDDFHKI